MFGSARIPRLVFGTSVFGFLAVCSFAWADVNPSPLQSAYWRFEQGPNGSLVSTAASDTVIDTVNANHLSAFNSNTAPTYTNSVPPKALRSGAANTLALSFTADPHTGGGDDLFTQFSPGKPINNGTIAAGGGFTVEAAFKTNNPALFAGIVGKEGQPGGSRPQPTFVLKTRADNSLLQVEQWDGAANLVQVSSLAPLVAGQWYYTAVVNTGSTLSLYLDSGSGYQLQGSVAVSGALYQGNPASPNWDNSWTVGRGQFNGAPADWFNGIIDEVRLTNSALSPSQFVFNSSVVGLAGDFNNNGKVDAGDYVTWRKNNGTNNALANDNGLGTPIGPSHYDLWRANFGNPPGAGSSGLVAGTVPEPTTLLLVFSAIIALPAA